MTVTTLASRRRHPDFDTAAEAVTPFGFAIGLPDDAGKPQVMATMTLVGHCSICRCDMPVVHAHARSPVGLDDGVDMLHLSSRVRNALRREHIVTVRDLVDRSGDELLDIRSFGVGCLAEVVAEIARHGLALKPDQRVDPAEPLRRRMHAEADAVEASSDALSLIRARTEGGKS